VALSHVIENTLCCQSPKQLLSLLRRNLSSDGPDLPRGPLRILDVAAGNGRVAVELREQLSDQPGVERLVGTDLLESAKMAALRDRRPGLYDEYVVADFTDPKAIEGFK